MFGRNKKDQKEPEGETLLPEYDYARDGPLVFPKLRKTDVVLEAYWIEPGLTRVSIIRSSEYENIYIAHEPALTPFEAELLERLQPAVRDLLIMKDIDVTDMKLALYEAIDYLINSYGLPVENASIYKIRYYLKRSFFGWGRIDILRGDYDIEDISCSGYNLPVYLYNRKYRDIKTSISFPEPRELDNLVVLFAQKSGKHISLSNPIVDATLSDGSRIQLTYGTVVSSRGSSFTIRKFRRNPFSPIDLLVNGTFSIDEMVYLWMAVQYNYSILVVGGTASGKTTTLNALAQFIPALSKVVTIEDTREITLDHDNWIASIVPPSAGATESASRDINMFDLLKASMRQRPEYIIVGEVRGVEAQTLFQAMNSGHTTFSTLHGGDVTTAIHRLQNPPLDVPKATIETLDIVLSQGRLFRGAKQIRRCKEIVEIVGMTDVGELEINSVFTYNFQKDAPAYSGSSDVYTRIAEKTGMNIVEMEEEILQRKSVLQAMLDQGIRDYRDFARIIWLHLSRTDYLLENLHDLTVLLSGGKKTVENLKNIHILKDEYPEMVDGAAESDAAYETGSAISDQARDMVSKSEPEPAPEKPAAKPVIIPMEGMPVFKEPKAGAEDSKNIPEPDRNVEDYFFDVNGKISSEENLPDSPEPEQVRDSSHPDAEMKEKESTSEKK
jgi:flagellar protein FlaI